MLAYYRSQEVMPHSAEIICPECESSNLKFVDNKEYFRDEYYVCRDCHFEFVMYITK